MRLQALFFDAAGTLIEPAEPVGATYARFAAVHGIHVDSAAVMQAFRRAWKASPAPLHPPGQAAPDDDRSWWRALVAEVFGSICGEPLDEGTLEPLFESLYGHFALPQAWAVFDDVLPALEDLAQDHRLLVLSNFDRRLRAVLAGHDLTRFFHSIVLSSEVGASKPHPRMFQAALAAAGCAPGDCLHIGDDAKCDAEGALAAGTHFFAVHRPGEGLRPLVQKVRSGAYSGLRSPA